MLGWPKSIPGKIHLAIALTSAGVVFLLAAVLTYSQYSRAKHDLTTHLHTLSQMAASNLAVPLAFGDPEDAQDALGAFQAVPDMINVMVSRADRTVFVRQSFGKRAPIGFPATPLADHEPRWQDDHILVCADIAPGGESLGTFWLACGLDSFHDRVREIVVLGIYLYVLATVLAALVAWLLQRLITRPILELAQVADRITQQGPSAVRAEKQANDEIGVLVDSFNLMLDHIAAQSERLSERERCYRTLFSQAASAVLLENVDRRIVEANHTAAEVFSQSQEALIDKPTADLLVVPGGLPAPAVGERVRIPEGKALRPDGTTVPIELTVTGIEDEGQHLFLTSAVDITDRLQARALLMESRDQLKERVDAATAELRETNEDLRREVDERRRLERQMMMSEKLKSLGLMAGGIAHDFNNLLQAILGNTDLVLIGQQDDLDEDSRICLEETRQAARTAAGLAGQMLAYAGKSALRIAPLDVNDVIHSMVPLIEAAISKNAQGVYELAEELPRIDADEGQFREVIMNLVSNAAESLPAEGGTYTVRTGLRHCDTECLQHTVLHEDLEAGRYLTVSVADTGSGIEPDMVESIFDPFFTTKFVGRGLGLAGVLGIVRAHRAAISVESEPGKGSTFTVYFPVGPAGAAVLDMPAVALEDWRGEGLAVVTDDEEMVRHVAQRMLKGLGFQVETAEDGEQAVELCRQRNPEVRLYILDVSMPGIGGIEAAQQIRALAPDACIVLSSAYDREQVMAQLGELTIAGFLHKPYERDTLRSQIAQILSR